jgi:dihydrofolate reductase
MNLAIIVAMTDEGIIGKDNALPWRLPEDLKRFQKLTLGHPIIMGRKTFESIGKPLHRRENIVLTQSRDFHQEGVHMVHSFESALKLCDAMGEAGKKRFAIGGRRVFEEALPLANTLYLTYIHHPFSGDTYFPKFELEKDFDINEQSEHISSSEPNFKYTFLTATRKSG